jgi:hypothetical protein
VYKRQIPNVADPADQTLCVGTASSVTFTSPVNIAGTTYSWSNDNIATGLGAGTSISSGTRTFTATNNTNAPITSTVTVYEWSNQGVTCQGASQTFTITVNPIPNVADPVDQTLCVGTSTSVSFTSPLNVAGTVYTWSNNNTASGLAASGTGNIASFVTTNTTNAPITSTVTVTPSYTNQGTTCTGPAQTFTITVNPIPNVTAPANQTLCVGTSTSVSFTSPLNVAGTVYTWVNDNTATGLGAGSTGNIGTFTTTNNTNAAITSTVTVTPSYTNQSVTCTGTPQTFTITVNPIPNLSLIHI